MERFSKREAISFGWDTMKANFWFWVLILLAIIVISGILQVPSSYLDNKVHWAVLFLIGLIAYLIQVVIYMGEIRIVLKFCDLQEPAFKDLFTTWRPVFKVFIASVLYGLITVVGLVLLIIPGIIWAIRFQFYMYHIIDRDSGPIEALKQSFIFTKGHTWNLFLLAIIIFGINLLGFLALLVGLFATIPATAIAHGYVYRRLFPANQVIPTQQGPVIYS
jgi:uncharacterized membrane protein